MTAAFQGNAFQPNAFQMGSDGVPPEIVIQISDGNDTVTILHEQDQHTDHLGTTEFYPQNSGICVTPSVVNKTSGSAPLGASFSASYPTGIVSGELLLAIVSHQVGTTDITATGWTTLYTSGTGTNPEHTVIYRWADGTESGSVTLTRVGSTTAGAYAILRIAGADRPLPNFGVSVTTASTSTGDPPSVTTDWASTEPTLYLIMSATDSVVGLTTPSSGYALELASSGGLNSEVLIQQRGGVGGTEDPSTYTISKNANKSINTVAIRGACNQDAGLPRIALDEQDFTDTEDYTSITPRAVPDRATGTCYYPAVKGTATYDSANATSHAYPVPSGASAGDRLIILSTGNNSSPSFPDAGWQKLGISTATSGYTAYKDLDGTEGSTITVTFLAAVPGVANVFLIAAGTFDPDIAPFAPSPATGTDTNPNPPLATPNWVASEPTLWIGSQTYAGSQDVTAYPANCPDNRIESAHVASTTIVASATAYSVASSFDPGTFTTSGSVNWSARTVAVKGICGLASWQDYSTPNESYGFDLDDYGYTLNPTEDAVIAPEDFLLGTGDGLDTQDFTDEGDYGFVQQPGFEQDHHLGTGDGLDDQDFTDTADYGSVAPQAIPDNNPEIAPSSLDDQDFTDTADYGDFVDPAIDDNNLEIAPSSLDDQDFTDFTDYSDYVLQLSDDFVLREDFILGDGQGLDTQDFTDEADYGDFVEPLSGDSVDFLLGTGDGLDFQDFTDTEDYSYTLAPLSDNNNPDVAPSSLDDQDFTDLEDYGSTTPQAVPDNNPQVCVAAVALDDQDFTDTADYGFLVTPLSDDNNPEISVAAVALDDQDFTDLEDYGSFTPQANDDFIAPEDFILGDGQGLDTQDFTDTEDYGYVAWLTPESVTEVYVNGVLITVSIGCFHIDAWQVISDPSTSWSGIAEPSTLWNGIPDVSTVWSTPSDGTTDWTEIPNPSTSWTEEC